jgi:pimeloyl-ACP methyl ester carboxylesterase
LAAVLATGCGGAHPTQTTRPEVSVAPWEVRTVRSADTAYEYEYLFAGGPSDDAPAILLLPGGFFDNRVWLNTHELSERFNVYALNWPDNSMLYDGHLENQGDIAHDFLKTLGIDELYLAGVSAGSYAAVDLASRKKDLDIKALFLFASVMLAINDKEVDKRSRLTRLALGLPPDRARALVEHRVGKTDFHRAPGDLQMEDIFYVRPYSYYYQAFNIALNQGDKKQATARIQSPTLAMVGTSDDLMDIELARLTPSVFPDAEFKEFEGYEHDMVFTHGPELVDAMTEFLDRRSLAQESQGLADR